MRRRLTISLIAVVAAAGGAVAAAAAMNYASTSNGGPDPVEVVARSEASPAPSPEDRLASAVAADASAGACEPIARTIRAVVRIADRQKDAASTVTDLRESARFVRSNPWATQKPHHRTDLRRALRRLVDPLASAAVAENDLSDPGNYQKLILDECQLERPLERAQASAGTADTAIRKLRARAERAPWWPVGYTRLNDDVAWQPYSSSEYSYAPCEIAFSACLKGRVVTRVQCQSVYFQANIYDSGRQIVDWSNDSLGVINAGETAVVEFVSSVEGHLSWRVTNVACN